MMSHLETTRFIEGLKQETHIEIIIGTNAYIQEINNNILGNLIIGIFIDLSQIDPKDFGKIMHYAFSEGNIVEEIWTDWGKFLKIFIDKK